MADRRRNRAPTTGPAAILATIRRAASASLARSIDADPARYLSLIPPLGRTVPTGAEAFSGAGLFSLAMAVEGVDVKIHCELWKPAVKTLQLNGFSDAVVCDAWEWMPPTPPDGLDILAGGPPCQPWSQAGKRRGEADPRNLWPRIIEWVRHSRPRVVLMENVAGIKEAAHADFFAWWWGELADLGYEGVLWDMNAADYGTPQPRKRTWFVLWPIGAIWGDTLRNPPPVTHGHPESAEVKDGLLLPWTRAFDRVTDGCCGGYGYYTCLNLGNYQGKCDGCIGGSNYKRAEGDTRKHTLNADQLLRAVRQWKGHPGLLLQDAPETIEGTSVREYLHATLTKGHGKGAQLPVVQRWEAMRHPGEIAVPPAKPEPPACEIDWLAHTIHNALRYMTPREAAKIMDVPQWYRFGGTEHQAVQQLGNGIAVNMGRAVTQHVLGALGYPVPVKGSAAASQHSGLWPLRRATMCGSYGHWSKGPRFEAYRPGGPGTDDQPPRSYRGMEIDAWWAGREAARSGRWKGTRSRDYPGDVDPIIPRKWRNQEDEWLEGFDVGALLDTEVGRAPEGMGLAAPAEVADSIYFASGSNHPGEIRGFAGSGQHLGVAAPDCNAECEAALADLAGTGVQVFVDSGAFSEVELNAPAERANAKKGIKKGELPYPDLPPFTWVTVKPITPERWDALLSMYERLAIPLGDQLHAVAPDKVGDQNVTLERLEQYRDRIERIRALGARIIVPLQGGAMDLPTFDRAVQRILGHADYTVGIPSKKAATSLEAIAGFLRYRQPSRMHFLGLADRTPRGKETKALVHQLAPGTLPFFDSVLIRAHVGRDKPGGRALTAAQDVVQRDIRAEAYQGQIEAIDWTEDMGGLDWLTTAARKRLRKEIAGWSDEETLALFDSDLDEWWSEADDWSFQAVQAEWDRYTDKRTVAEKKQRAVAEALPKMLKAKIDPEAGPWANLAILAPEALADESPKIAKAVIYTLQQQAVKPLPALIPNRGGDRPDTAYTLPEQILRKLSKVAPVELKKWMGQNRAQVYGVILRALRDRAKLPWYAIFSPVAAPGRRERGFGEEPAYGVDTKAQSILQNVILYWNEPEFAQGWYAIIGEDSTGFGLEPSEELDEYADDLADYIGIPYYLADDTKLAREDRWSLAEYAVRLAAWAHPEYGPEWLEYRQAELDKHADEYGVLPDWVVIGALSSVLAGAHAKSDKLALIPVSKQQAADYVREHHSKLPGVNPRGLLYALGVQYKGRLVAVATVNTPTGRWSKRVDPKNVVELTRVASDGSVKGASSMLVARIIDLLPRTLRGTLDGPYLFITYQLDTESGTTYRALADKGLRPVAYTKGKQASGARKKGTARDYDPLAEANKIRWEAGPAALPAAWELLD